MGAADIRLHEGFVDHWYRDPVGIGTLGCGFTWRSAAFRDWWAKHRPGQAFMKGATMTRAEADDCLVVLADQQYGAACNRFLGGKVVVQHVFDAMTSVTFNCGELALSWTWAKLIKTDDIAGAADHLRVTAITAEGRRLAGLVSRREDEASLMEFGRYASGGHASMPDDHALSDGLLSRGERGEAVANLQLDLVKAGFQPGKPDGIFGFGTEAALLSFQKAKGLVEDGKAGPKTLSALRAA